MSNSFENYKFVMLSSNGNSNRRRTSREHDQQASKYNRNDYSHERYSHNSDRYRVRSPLPGASSGPHVYRGGTRQFPSSAHYSSFYSTRGIRGLRGSGAPLRRFSSRGAPPFRGSFRSRGSLSSSSSRGFSEFSTRRPRGSFRGSSSSRGSFSRGALHGGIRRSVSPIRKVKHSVPYAVSPVRAEAETPCDELLTKSELMSRMKQAKENDDLDELYRYRELYREMIENGERSIKVEGRSRNEDSEPAEWDLEEVECIEETLEDDDDDEIIPRPNEKIDRKRQLTNSKTKLEKSGGHLSRKHLRTRTPSVNENEQNETRPKRSEDAAPLAEHDFANRLHSRCDDGNSTSRHGRAIKRRRREKRDGERGDSFGEEEDYEDEEEEAACLEFAEDSLDVETIVKASSRRSNATSRADETAVLNGEEDEFLAAIMDDGDDYEMEYADESANWSDTPSLALLASALVQEKLASMTIEKRNQLYKKLLSRQKATDLSYHSAYDISETARQTELRRILPLLIRSLVSQLLSFSSKSSFLHVPHMLSARDAETKVQEIMAIFEPQFRLLNAENSVEDAQREEWTIEADSSESTKGDIPSLTEKCLSQIIGTVLQQLNRKNEKEDRNVPKNAGNREALNA